MDAIQAVQLAVTHSQKIKVSLRPDLSFKITEDFHTEDFWMDRITPKAYFVSDIHLIGFVYSIMINHVNKD